ncbi:MAG: paraquat-inducible protein A [Gammaproteobacteria bacterium]
MAAYFLYLPANLLPIMETASLFGSQTDTILSGIVFLWASGSWPLAIIVFVASILVPLGKLGALTVLLLSVHYRWQSHRLDRARLYRLIEFVGRWSMLDIYVVTILVALVQVQTFAAIEAAPGAIAFGAVVVLTMLATASFDPRLIWESSAHG